MKMDQFAKSLDSGDHAGHHVVPLEHAAVDLDHAFPGGAGQLAEQTAVVAAVDPQPFGDRKDKLPVGDGGADRVRDGVGSQQRAFLMATGAQTPLAAGEGNEHLVAAVRTSDTRETEVQVAAAEEFAGHLANDRPPCTVELGITLVVGALELRVITLDDLVERRQPGLARAIDGRDRGNWRLDDVLTTGPLCFGSRCQGGNAGVRYISTLHPYRPGRQWGRLERVEEAAKYARRMVESKPKCVRAGHAR